MLLVLLSSSTKQCILAHIPQETAFLSLKFSGMPVAGGLSAGDGL